MLDPEILEDQKHLAGRFRDLFGDLSQVGRGFSSSRMMMFPTAVRFAVISPGWAPGLRDHLLLFPKLVPETSLQMRSRWVSQHSLR